MILATLAGAVNIVEQVFAAASGWREKFKACGVMTNDIERFVEIDDYLRR